MFCENSLTFIGTIKNTAINVVLLNYAAGNLLFTADSLHNSFTLCFSFNQRLRKYVVCFNIVHVLVCS